MTSKQSEALELLKSIGQRILESDWPTNQKLQSSSVLIAAMMAIENKDAPDRQKLLALKLIRASAQMHNYIANTAQNEP